MHLPKDFGAALLAGSDRAGNQAGGCRLDQAPFAQHCKIQYCYINTAVVNSWHLCAQLIASALQQLPLKSLLPKSA